MKLKYSSLNYDSGAMIANGSLLQWQQEDTLLLIDKSLHPSFSVGCAYSRHNFNIFLLKWNVSLEHDLDDICPYVSNRQ